MQIIWYPLFGQLYVLANHLRIDRSNPTAAIESMKEVSLFPPHCLACIFFPCISNLWSLSCPGSPSSGEKQPVFDHFSWGYQVQKWTITPLQEGINSSLVWSHYFPHIYYIIHIVELVVTLCMTLSGRSHVGVSKPMY